MSTLSKAKIVEALCVKQKLSRTEAKEFVDLFYEKLKYYLERGHHIKLSGFGNFILRDKPQRVGRNPKTGEEIPISSRRVVTFKAGSKIKKAMELLKGKEGD